jgi:hypothetical protein
MLLGLSTVMGQTQVVVSSLSSFNSNVDVGTILFGNPYAISSPFRTGPQACTLNAVTVLLGTPYSGGATNVSPANVRVFSDSGGQPGTLLEDLGWQQLTNFYDGYVLPPYTFSASGQIALNPFTTYWVSVGTGTNGFIAAALDINLVFQPFQYVGAPGTTMIATNYMQYQYGPWYDPDDSPLLFELDGTLLTPTLQATPIGQQLVLSWPSYATNYLLETSTSFGPGSVWTPVTNSVTAQGDIAVLTNTPSAPAAFFRLRAPVNGP